jgi:hypothetical protein
VAEPLGSRLRPARRSGLTSPEPVLTPRPAGHTATPPTQNPDKPQNRQRRSRHALKAPTDENSSHEINRWIKAKSVDVGPACPRSSWTMA